MRFSYGLAAVATLAPAVAYAQPPEPEPSAPPPPATYQPDTVDVYDTMNAPMFASGALLFGVVYGAGVFVAATDDNPGVKRLYVPVVGPWLALKDWRHCSISEPSCDATTSDKVLLVADGVAQAAGVLAMAGGLLMPSHHIVTRYGTATVRVTPTTNGVALLGSF